MDKSFWAGKNVLVTGGGGFLGSHLVDQLVKVDARVTVLDIFITSTPENLTHLRGRVNLLGLNIQDTNWAQLLEQAAYDIIFHMAGNANVPFSVKNPVADYQITLASSFAILEALRETNWPGTFIFPSSAAVYGNPARLPIHEDDPLLPISPYGVSKLAVERYISVYSHLYGLKAASIRMFSVYGPRLRKQVVYDLIVKIEQNPAELRLYGDGTQTRDFIYIADVVQAMLRVAENGRLTGETYNVASGQEQSINTLADKLCQIMGVVPRFLYSGSVRPGEPEKWSVDISRMKELGFKPEYSLEDGLKKTVEWYHSNFGT